VTDGEFKQVLEDLLALIFEASSRQHQYTEMYTDLCQKLMDFVGKQRPDFDSRCCVWAKCQGIFETMVLAAPDIPSDIPEDEYVDRKAKRKEKMVGIVKFGGDLVSRGLVPSDGVMLWLQTLLSEKRQELHDADQGGEEPHDKDVEQREVQLELLCAVLAGMGSSMDDDGQALTRQNRLVIEDVFNQLEQLSMDTANLSLRIRCLIRDILDLRMAQWKEKEYKTKPGMLIRRESDDPEVNSYLREDAPEFVPGSNAAWTSDRVGAQQAWLDPALLASLQAVEHHLEVIDDRGAKMQRLARLIKFYRLIQEQQLVIVANSSNVSRILDLIDQSFSDISCHALEMSCTEQQRRSSLRGFELGEVSVLVMASEVSTRRDFDISAPTTVLVNFDFPMTLQLYLYRLFKRTNSNTHVYTFFTPHFDVRHTVSLAIAMQAAAQKIPDALRKLKDQLVAEGGSSSSTGGKGRDRNHERDRELRGGDRNHERDRDRDRDRDRERDRERDRDRDRDRDDSGHKGAGRHDRARATRAGSWRSDVTEVRSERSEVRGDRSERGDRGDRCDRGDRGERAERGERGDRGERAERGDRGERAEFDDGRGDKGCDLSSRSDRESAREGGGGRREARAARPELTSEDAFSERPGASAGQSRATPGSRPLRGTPSGAAGGRRRESGGEGDRHADAPLSRAESRTERAPWFDEGQEEAKRSAPSRGNRRRRVNEERQGNPS